MSAPRRGNRENLHPRPSAQKKLLGTSASLLVTSASLVVTSALLVVTMFAINLNLN